MLTKDILTVLSYKIKKMKPSYRYNLKRALKLLSFEKQAHTHSNVLDSFAVTEEKISHVFNEYSLRTNKTKANYAFVIPTRASRFSADYWEEVYEFFPAFRHMTHEMAYKILALIPPFKVTSYGEKDSPKGVVIFAPIYEDMSKDFRTKLGLLLKMRNRVSDSVDFARRVYGVKYVGLGAMLPKITNYGKTIRSKVVTTTGHAGTSWLIAKFVESAMKDIPTKPGKQIVIGFIGGGSIGLASMQIVSEIYPDVEIITYDKREDVNLQNQNIMRAKGVEILIAKNNDELLLKSDIVVSAITSVLHVYELDLRGKIIIDDSQPGSFIREEVEDAGGKLTWVVGRDSSAEKIFSRNDNYHFGPRGLVSSVDVWGCEAEVGVISYFDRPDLAVSGPVDIRSIKEVGKLLEEVNIHESQYQSYGSPQ